MGSISSVESMFFIQICALMILFALIGNGACKVGECLLHLSFYDAIVGDAVAYEDDGN